MTWKSIDGYEGLYEVSDTGLVRSLNFNHTGKAKILKPGKHRSGYLIVQLCRDGKCKTASVHRLVANAFVSNPLKLETVNHKDEDKQNNAAGNLEWMTLADNLRYGTHDLRAGFAHRKPVLQLDKSGNVVKRFSSTHEAECQTGIKQGNIVRCCRGRRRSAGGYVWKYA